MRYLGGKVKISKRLLPVLSTLRKPGQLWVEPFVGAAGMFDKVTGPKLGADANPYMIALLCAARDGWEPPQHVPEPMYRAIKQHPQAFPPELVGFVGVGCSFGGIWLGSYARCATARNYAVNASRALAKSRAGLLGSVLLQAEYDQLAIPPNSFIYCDPPYAGTAGYKFGGVFDSARFWQWCHDRSAEGHTVTVSEYNAPPDAVLLFEEVKKVTFSTSPGIKSTERCYLIP